MARIQFLQGLEKPNSSRRQTDQAAFMASPNSQPRGMPDALSPKVGQRKIAVWAASPAVWIFLTFFGFMLVQQRYVFIYHDDYGYASLSYAVNIAPVQGHVFTPSQLGEFLARHYRLWGGRVLFIAAEILALRWGLWPYRVVQAVILTTILGLIYKLLQQGGQRGKNQALTALLLCCCYGLISLEIHRNGTYWASAAATYVWPFLALFAAVVIHSRLEDWIDRPGWWILLLGILYFASGWSQEQTGLVSIFTILGLALIHLRQGDKSNALAVDALALICTLAGFTLLVLAPGNQARLNNPIYLSFNTLGLADKIKANLPLVRDIVLGQHNHAILLLWAWSSAAAMWISSGTGVRLRRLYLGLFAFCFLYGCLLSGLAIPPVAERMPALFEAGRSRISLLFWAGYLGANVLAVFVFCLEKKKPTMLSIFTGGLLSQIGMLVSPSLNIRSSLVFLYSLFPVLVSMMVTVLERARSQVFLARLALLVIFSAAAINTLFIIRGYAANSLVMDSNDLILRSAARSISHGAEISQIELKKLPDDLFGGEMPYRPGYDYINSWIKEYYNLPLNVDLIWK